MAELVRKKLEHGLLLSCAAEAIRVLKRSV
jgi:hypothetical protein